MRDREGIERAALAAGADRVIVGTRAVEDPVWLARAAAAFPERVVVAADMRDGRVLRRGWTRASDTAVEDFSGSGGRSSPGGRTLHRRGPGGDACRAATSNDPRPSSGRRPTPSGFPAGSARWTSSGASARREPRERCWAWPSTTAPCAPRRSPGNSADEALEDEGVVRMGQILRETGETRVRVLVNRGDQPPRIDTGDGFSRPHAGHLRPLLRTRAGGRGAGRPAPPPRGGRGDRAGDGAGRHRTRARGALRLGAGADGRSAGRGRPSTPGVARTTSAICRRASPITSSRVSRPISPQPLHIRVIRGRNRHHVIEAAVKATGLALRQALEAGDSVFSTKGQVRVTRDPAPEA